MPLTPYVEPDRLPCATDLHLWFAERPELLAVAQGRCRACSHVEPCLTGAIARGEPWGVWGGRVFVDGSVVTTKRGRGRPRRTVPAGGAS